ncbi:SGNH/GDSL hydrolase family protein [Mycobacterium sp. pV006]|uniref:SGNH/GDSL hydrolase family protein n=1 Tax=Mycobacterium sp. pV006 TaxID=3238983 RepID=UPI00351B0C56
MDHYVALGSSMAAGPGIRPRAPGSPRRAGRSARNYPHLVAERLGLHLVDVTYSGATTAHVLTERQNGAPPQADALDGSETLVTVTIGGNDIGYVPMLFAAGLPRWVQSIPLVGAKIRDLLDPQVRQRAIDELGESLIEVGQTLRARAPKATVLFVDYLTFLPDEPPLREADAALARHLAERLEHLTADAASATGCGLVRAGAASRDHHAWSTRPWTTPFGWPLPGRPAPLHPNAAGMRAVADLVVSAVRG